MSKNIKCILVLIFPLLLQTIVVKAQNINLQLMEAAKRNDFELIKKLVDQGADVNYTDENKATVLMWATYAGDIETVKYLVSKKADFNRKGAIYTNEEKTAYYGNLLGIAVGENKQKILKFFIEKCKISIEDKELNVETQIETGWTAMQWAAFKGKKEIAEYLIEKGANININHLADRSTPLIYALQNQKYETALFLIKEGADVNIQEATGWTALHYAVRAGKDEIVEMLLKQTANPNLQGNTGYTPLMLAAYNNKIKICFNLIENGADTKLKHSSGKKAEDFAKDNGFSSVYDYLTGKTKYSLNDINETQTISIDRAFELYNAKKYEEAAIIFEKVLPTIKEQFGENDTTYYTKIILYTAMAYENASNKTKSIEYYSLGISVYEMNKPANENIWHAIFLNNLALIFTESGDYLQAEPLFLESKQINELIYGKNHPKYIDNCNSLASLNSDMGNYQKSEALFMESKELYERNFGKETFEYASCCNEFGILYYNMGKYESAKTLYQEAKDIYERIYGKDHSLYGTSCNNLATLYYEIGNFREAERLLLESKKISEKVYGKNHKDYAVSLNNIAELYKAIGNYKKAEELYLEAKNIEENTLGKEHPSYAISCFNLATIYYYLDNYSEAESLYLESKKIRERVYGKEHPSYAAVLSGLATLYQELGSYSKAELLFLEAKRIEEKVLGKEHLSYAISCDAIAYLYRQNDNFLKAEPLFLEAKNIREKILGKEHPDYATSCSHLASLYHDMGQYQKAELLFIEAKNIKEDVFGSTHFHYASGCNDLASLYSSMGNYSKAESLYLEAKKIRAKEFGKQHPEYAASCGHLADLYNITGKLSKAEPLFLEAKNVTETVYGKEHLSYVMSCNNLAEFYRTVGDYPKSEPLFIEAKKLCEKIVGNAHSDYAVICNNLALLYADLGNYKKAEPLHIEAIKIREKVYGKEHYIYSTSCNNLALIYYYSGYYIDAEPLFQRSKTIREKALGKEHPSYAVSLNNLALVYYSLGKYNEVEQLYKEAKNIYAKAYGKNHRNYATGCDNLGMLYQKLGDTAKVVKEREIAYKKAEKQYIEAKEIRKKLLGNRHVKYAMSCTNLAGLYTLMGHFKKSETLYIEANKIMNVLSQQSAKFMSEKEREDYLTFEIGYYFEFFHSFFLVNQKENKTLPAIIYNNALNIKGQLLRSATAVRKAVLQSGDEKLINTYSEMNNYGEILAQQYALPIEKRRSDINTLEEKLNTLEKELIRFAADFQSLRNLKNIEWQDVQHSLNKNETAIEFISFEYHNNKKWTGRTFYYALVLRKGYKYPKAVFLFEQNSLKKIMNTSTATSEFDLIKKLYDPKSAKADSLYQLVWKPLEPYLNDIKHVYISPTGMLNKVSFDALPYDSVNILSDKYKIIYTTNTGQVLNKTGLYQKDIKSSVLFGGIDFEIKPDEMEKLAERFKNNDDILFENILRDLNEIDLPVLRSESIDSLSRNVTWNYLPGSLAETEEIYDVLKKKNVNVKLYSQKTGSEEQFKMLENNAPSVLHVSTHGFYFGDDEKSNRYKKMIDKDIKFAHSDNPLLRSGFILAGGNTAFQGDEIPEGVEDGVLTALEISRLNFFNTKLAVLSACQTGLGDVKGSEGVYGLQRSFKMAGVDYLLFSLWEVPDETTKELMSNFYQNWFSGMEIREAFKKAQNHLKEKYKDIPGAAFAWAAFVLMK